MRRVRVPIRRRFAGVSVRGKSGAGSDCPTPNEATVENNDVERPQV